MKEQGHTNNKGFRFFEKFKKGFDIVRMLHQLSLFNPRFHFRMLSANEEPKSLSGVDDPLLWPAGDCCCSPTTWTRRTSFETELWDTTAVRNSSCDDEAFLAGISSIRDDAQDSWVPNDPSLSSCS